MGRLNDAQKREVVRAGVLTVNEAAAELRCSRSVVYRLIETRKLRATRAGERLRIPRSAIEAYLAAGLV